MDALRSGLRFGVRGLIVLGLSGCALDLETTLYKAPPDAAAQDASGQVDGSTGHDATDESPRVNDGAIDAGSGGADGGVVEHDAIAFDGIIVDDVPIIPVDVPIVTVDVPITTTDVPVIPLDIPVVPVDVMVSTDVPTVPTDGSSRSGDAGPAADVIVMVDVGIPTDVIAVADAGVPGGDAACVTGTPPPYTCPTPAFHACAQIQSDLAAAYAAATSIPCCSDSDCTVPTSGNVCCPGSTAVPTSEAAQCAQALANEWSASGVCGSGTICTATVCPAPGGAVCISGRCVATGGSVM